MKILFITNTPAPYRVNFFNELGKKCNLTVLYEYKKMSDRNNKWYSEGSSYFNEVFLQGFSIKGKLISFEIKKYLSEEYDLIVIGGGYSSPTIMLTVDYLDRNNIPFVICVDGGLVKDDSKLKKYIKRYFMSKAVAWLSTGKITDEYLSYYGADKKRIFHYPFTPLMRDDILPGLIPTKVKYKIRDSLKIKEDKVVISVGRFIHGKGFDILLKAAKGFGDNIGVYIIGGEPTEEYLNLIEDYGLKNINFVGFKSKEELQDYYKAADLFVLPTRGEAWGLVIQEAMACGLPVITTDKCVAGLELIKDYENGFIIPVDNSILLGDKTQEILSNERIQTRMGLNNLEKIMEYTIENQAQRFVDLFDKLDI